MDQGVYIITIDIVIIFTITMFLIMTAMLVIITMIRFFETETASICLDFTECGPCYEAETWA